MRNGNVTSCATKVAILGAILVVTGCGGQEATDNRTPGQGGPETQEVASTADGGESQQDTTVVTDDSGNEAEAPVRTNLTADMIPSVGDLPASRSMEEISEAVIRHMSEDHPYLDVTSVELLGGALNDYGGAQNAVNDFWCSYLVHCEGDGTIGLEVTCSEYMRPYVSEPDFLRTSNGQAYDVSNGRYVSQDEVPQPSESASEAYADDPSHGYNESNPAPHTSVLVSDDHGNEVWVTIKDDLG